MLHRTLCVVCALLLLGLMLTGCGKQEPESSAIETTVKTMDEYSEAAEEEITEENVDAELEELEKEIDADITP